MQILEDSHDLSRLYNITSMIVNIFYRNKVSSFGRKYAKFFASNHSLLKPMLLELLDRCKICQVFQMELGFARRRYVAKFVLCLRRVRLIQIAHLVYKILRFTIFPYEHVKKSIFVVPINKVVVYLIGDPQ